MPAGKSASDRLKVAVHLDFAEAQAYCPWAGGRLPTGAEWQTAGFTELRQSPPAPWQNGQTYAWTTGDSPQGANTSDADPWPRAAPAGATKQGVNGLYDMGANVWEWTTDSPDSKAIPKPETAADAAHQATPSPSIMAAAASCSKPMVALTRSRRISSPMR